MVARRLRPVPHLTTLRPCPPLSLVISWRKQADASLTAWCAGMVDANLAPKKLEESALDLVGSLRQELRETEVFPPTMVERKRRRQDALVWASEICRAAAIARDPVVAVRRVLRLWIGTAQQAAICGGAASFAA